MTKEPKFTVGDRVLDLLTRRRGTVAAIINEKDAEDVKAHGFRYEVSFRADEHGTAQLWSIVEKNLRTPEKS